MVKDRSKRREELESWLREIPARGLYFFSMEPSMCEDTIWDKFDEYLWLRLEDCGASVTDILDVLEFSEENKISIEVDYQFYGEAPVDQRDADDIKMETFYFDDEYQEEFDYGSKNIIELVHEIISAFISYTADELEHRIEMEGD